MASTDNFKPNKDIEETKLAKIKALIAGASQPSPSKDFVPINTSSLLAEIFE